MKGWSNMGNFKKVLRDLRTQYGLTQDALASKLGASKSTISMYENGNREPDFETLEAIADFFNVDMDYLLGRSKYNTSISTIAAHHDNEDWTPEELAEIEEFKKYVLSKRNK